MAKNYHLWIILFGLVAVAAGIIFLPLSKGESPPKAGVGVVVGTATPLVSLRSTTSPSLGEEINSSPAPTPKLSVLSVPFTPQAPQGQWSDPVFQDGCEEAAILMAARWVKGETKKITPAAATKEILAITAFEDKTYGAAPDRSAADTVRLMKDYFGHAAVAVKSPTTLEDIKQALAAGKLVILPMNGRALKNPFFTPPGPERHMLVVRGYDVKTDQFITNDPGTRRGDGYRYKASVIDTAWRDYLTGNHTPITIVTKAMIIVTKQGI